MKRETTTAQMAEYLRIHQRSFIDKLGDEYEEMPREKISGSWFFNINEVMTWIEERFNK